MTASSFAPNSSSSLSLSLLGTTLILSTLLLYKIAIPRLLPVSTETAGLLEESAYSTLCLVLTGLVLTFLGLTRFLMRQRLEERHDSKSTLQIMSSILIERRYLVLFVVAALTYGLLFAVTSGTLVYQPGTKFSDTYGVNVPSSIAVTCCEPLGQIPQFVFYLTEQIAVLLVPLNLVLLFAVSWLVGLNASMIAYGYKYRYGSVGRSWLGSVGVITGLFSACPTCAGLVFLAFLGLGGAVSSFASFNFQILLLSVGIPLLLMAPILTCRQIRAIESRTCSLPQSAK